MVNRLRTGHYSPPEDQTKVTHGDWQPPLLHALFDGYELGLQQEMNALTNNRNAEPPSTNTCATPQPQCAGTRMRNHHQKL